MTCYIVLWYEWKFESLKFKIMDSMYAYYAY